MAQVLTSTVKRYTVVTLLTNIIVQKKYLIYLRTSKKSSNFVRYLYISRKIY
jgi:hypothetical protein